MCRFSSREPSRLLGQVVGQKPAPGEVRAAGTVPCHSRPATADVLTAVSAQGVTSGPSWPCSVGFLGSGTPGTKTGKSQARGMVGHL